MSKHLNNNKFITSLRVKTPNMPYIPENYPKSLCFVFVRFYALYPLLLRLNKPSTKQKQF